MKRLLLSSILVILSITPMAYADCSLPKPDLGSLSALNDIRIQQIATALTNVHIKCADKVWPNSRWDDKKIRFFSAKENRAWEWTGGVEPKIVEIDFSTINPNFFYSGYSVDVNPETYELKMLINLDLADQNLFVDRAISLSSHEGFHFFEQSNMHSPWVSNNSSNNEGRVIQIPQDYRPRQLRYELQKKLEVAFLEKDKTKKEEIISEAKNLWIEWQNIAKEEIPQAREIEKTEGTSMFVEFISSQIVHDGCQNKEALITGLREQVRKNYENKSSPFLLELEGYDVGMLASLLLYESEDSDAWKLRIEKGESPVEILFENRKSIKSSSNSEIQEMAKSTIEHRNADVLEQLMPTLENFKSDSDDYVRVSIPANKMNNASTSHGGTYSIENTIVNLGHELNLSIDDAQIDLFGENTITTNATCGGRESLVFLVKATDFKKSFNNGEVKIQNESMNIQAKGALSQNREFCLK